MLTLALLCGAEAADPTASYTPVLPHPTVVREATIEGRGSSWRALERERLPEEDTTREPPLPSPNYDLRLLVRRQGADERHMPQYDRVPAIPPRDEPQPRRRVSWPEETLRRSTVLDPIPVPNNLQFYPFTLNLPMEGLDTPGVREISFSAIQIFADGAVSGRTSRYRLDMDQRFLEQDVRLGLGLPHDTHLQVAFPLYHYNGDTIFTQDGVEMIGLGQKTRSYWGGASLGLKSTVFRNDLDRRRVGLSAWFQFPEGNQRARGGTTSGHWAVSAIAEQYIGNCRWILNLGRIEAGDLRLLNDAVLSQRAAHVAALSLSRNIVPTLAWDLQLHACQSALRGTGLPDLARWNTYGSLGLRGQKRGTDFSLAVIASGADFPGNGLVGDLGRRW